MEVMDQDSGTSETDPSDSDPIDSDTNDMEPMEHDTLANTSNDGKFTLDFLGILESEKCRNLVIFWEIEFRVQKSSFVYG